MSCSPAASPRPPSRPRWKSSSPPMPASRSACWCAAPPRWRRCLSDNPFPEAAPNRTMALFLDRAPPADTLAGLRGRRDEQIQLGRREIYIHYGAGHGHVEAGHPRGQDGDRAQHEHRCDARQNGRRVLNGDVTRRVSEDARHNGPGTRAAVRDSPLRPRPERWTASRAPPATSVPSAFSRRPRDR